MASTGRESQPVSGVPYVIWLSAGIIPWFFFSECLSNATNSILDNSFLLIDLEERIRLFRWEVFNVTADWEVAPFIDMGAVMESLDKFNGRNFEFNPGIGFRAIVRPNIVGRVDLGVGKDGPAIFVGLGYPF